MRRGTRVVMRPSTSQSRKPVRSRRQRVSRAPERPNDGVLTTDRKGRILTASRYAAEMLGYRVEALEGLSIAELISAHQRRRCTRAIAKAGAVSSATTMLHRWDALRRDGSRFPTECLIAPRDAASLIWFIRDVTPRRQNEAEQHVLLNALRTSAVAISITDANASFQWVNPAFTLITGYTLEDVWGQSPRIFRCEQQDTAFYEKIWSTISSGVVWRGDVMRRRRDGTHYLADLMVCPVLDARGRTTHYLDFHTDITERSQLKAVVSERLASLGMLAATVGHEINNPLMYLLSSLDLAQEECQRFENRAGSAETQTALASLEDNLRSAREAVHRISEVVDNLRLLSRDDDKRRILDVRDALDIALRMASNEIAHRALVYKDYRPVRGVTANESRLTRAFLNILVNAAQAIPEGNRDKNAVRVSVRSDDNDGVIVEVSDTGHGMAKQVQTRIFDPFFTTKPPGLGTGLGLSICRQIVNEVGGTIGVESEPGVGTTFRILLPAATEPVESAALRDSSIPAPAKSNRRGRVLVIDDEPLIGSSLRRLLSTEHDVVTACNGKVALDLLEAQEFDVILCDMIMPEMSGPDVYERIKARNPELVDRIVFLTGGAFTPTAHDFLSRTGNLLLQKPVTTTELRTLVRRLVD